jgi:hypothetical protein
MCRSSIATTHEEWLSLKQIYAYPKQSPCYKTGIFLNLQY